MRIGFDVLVIVLVFIAPWWVVFIIGTIGAFFFEWYLEMFFIGILFDVMFGGGAMSWYRHIMHTSIFMFPIGIIEFIRPKINYYGLSRF